MIAEQVVSRVEYGKKECRGGEEDSNRTCNQSFAAANSCTFGRPFRSLLASSDGNLLSSNPPCNDPDGGTADERLRGPRRSGCLTPVFAEHSGRHATQYFTPFLGVSRSPF